MASSVLLLGRMPSHIGYDMGDLFKWEMGGQVLIACWSFTAHLKPQSLFTDSHAICSLTQLSFTTLQTLNEIICNQ